MPGRDGGGVPAREKLVFTGPCHSPVQERDRLLELRGSGAAPLLQAWRASPWAAYVPQGTSPGGRGSLQSHSHGEEMTVQRRSAAYGER